jgi:hypothetical protein
MDRIKLSFAAALAVGAFLAAPAARGTILMPGQSGGGDLFAFLPGATVVGSASGSFTSAAFTGHYIEEVFVDPANGFGANDLTWLIQVTNNGPESIGRITASSFAGFMADVGANDIGFIPPGFVGVLSKIPTQLTATSRGRSSDSPTPSVWRPARHRRCWKFRPTLRRSAPAFCPFPGEQST